MVTFMSNDVNVKSTSISLSDILASGGRLEASVFNIEAYQAKDIINKSPWKQVPLSSMMSNCFYPGRFKRNYLKKGIGFLGSAEMLNILPEPVKYMADNPSVKVRKGQILLSRSGTIGNVTYVNKTLEKFLVSEHAIRIEAKENAGYLYAFLKTRVGKLLIDAGMHGAVVSQLEPEHIQDIIVSIASHEIVTKIHSLIVQSFDLQDESNDLILEAKNELLKELDLPALENIKPSSVLHDSGLSYYSISMHDFENRLDSSYHNPIAREIVGQIKMKNISLVDIKDDRISQDIILPGRFKRIYVEEGYGVPFIGGKQIGTLDPRTGKNLSFQNHGDRIKEQLTIHENQVMITCSGTIGRVNIAPKHWDGWASSQHIIRITASSDLMAGYLYIWLSSEYGKELIQRFTYGSVVDEIDDEHIGSVLVPYILESKIASIGEKVLKANEKRYQAFQIEQQAINIFNESVLGLSKQSAFFT